MTIRFLLLALIATFLITSCNKKVAVPDPVKDIQSETLSSSPRYADDILAARKVRETRLKSPTGWLSVVGLHWLEEGMNSIGAAADNTIIFPSTTTETIGAYQKDGNNIFFGKVEEVEVLSNGEPYLGGLVDVQAFTVANHGSLHWYILKRGEKYGIRLKDTMSENRMNFKGIPYYEPDKKYRFNVQVTDTQDSMTITNVLGVQSRVKIAAYLNLYIAEELYSLAALDEGGDNYFLIFSDETSAVETYGGGRFLYPKKPCDTCEQITVLDFNLAQNPPCAFTDFATCPLPPKRNHLRFKVKAGEKTYGNH